MSGSQAAEVLNPGEVRELQPGIWWIRLPLPFGVDHINVWLLKDGDGWCLVDTGLSSRTGRELWNQLLPPLLDGAPLKRVIVTHFHPDHLGLAGWFCTEWGAELWIPDTEMVTARELIRRDGGAGDRGSRDAFLKAHGVGGEVVADLYRSADSYPQGIYELPEHWRSIGQGEMLEIDGVAWQARLGEGHTFEQLSLHSPQKELIISADDLLPDITTNVSLWHHMPDADPLGSYLETLAWYRDTLVDEQVLPAHGQPYLGARERAESLLAHYLDRVGRVWLLCDRPVDAATLTARLFRRKLQGFHVLLAVGETLAGLNYLWHRGYLERGLDDDGIVRFQQGQRRWADPLSH